MKLGEFLKANLDRSWQAGVWDCASLPAAWVMECGYGDPMAAWRGLYDTEEAAQRLIRDAGGLTSLFAEGLSTVGIDKPGDPVSGDIAVLNVMTEQAGAIWTGRRWALAGLNGLVFATVNPAHVERIWHVPHG
jgi:hypothetical protein